MKPNKSFFLKIVRMWHVFTCTLICLTTTKNCSKMMGLVLTWELHDWDFACLPQPRNVKNLLVVCVTAKFHFSHGQTSHFELGGILVKSLSNDKLFCIKPLVMCCSPTNTSQKHGFFRVKESKNSHDLWLKIKVKQHSKNKFKSKKLLEPSTQVRG